MQRGHVSSSDSPELGPSSKGFNERARRAKDQDSSDACSVDSSSEDTGLTRDDEFWYQDGSIVLVAQCVGFRVYRELLAERSAVFRDLFSVPQPLDSQSICGCPVVHLSDTIFALKAFLRMLLRGQRYVEADDPTLGILASRIRLAHKYDVEDLLEDSIHHLQTLYSSDLASLHALPCFAEDSRAITAVNLANLTDTRSVLLAALYSCCQLREKTLLTGVAHPDGSVDTLSEGDLARCMLGKTRLAFIQGASLGTLFHSPAQDCHDPSRCEQTLRDIHEDAEASVWGATGIFVSWMDVLRGSFEDALCSACSKAIERRSEAFRETAWLGLSEHFGLV